MQEQKASESGKNTWTYTLADEFDNLSTVERDTPPTIVEWEYTCRGESFKAETKEAAETLMVKYFESCTPYRGFIQIAKYLGYGIFLSTPTETAMSGAAIYLKAHSREKASTN